MVRIYLTLLLFFVCDAFGQRTMRTYNSIADMVANGRPRSTNDNVVYVVDVGEFKSIQSITETNETTKIYSGVEDWSWRLLDRSESASNKLNRTNDVATGISVTDGTGTASIGNLLSVAGVRIHNVKAYNAPSDGSNASAQIQTAIDAATNAIVYFPRGTGDYGLDTPLTIPANRKLVFEHGARLYPRTGFSSNATIYVTGAIEIHDIEANGENMPIETNLWDTSMAPKGVCIYVDGRTGARLSDVKIIGGKISHYPFSAVFAQFVDQIHIDRLNWEYCATNAVATSPAAVFINEFTDATVDRPRNIVSGMKGISLSNGSRGRVWGGYFTGGNTGHAYVYISNSEHVAASLNHFDGGFGVKLTETSAGRNNQNSVIDNVFTGCDTAIFQQGGLKNKLNGNHIFNTTNDAIQVADDPTGSPVSDTEIIGNDIWQTDGIASDSDREAIQLFSSSLPVSHIKIKDNMVDGSSYGVRIRSSSGVYNSIEISGNTFKNLKLPAISSFAQNITIRENTITNCIGGSVEINGIVTTQTGVTIVEDNIIHPASTTASGINVNSTHYADLVRISRNQIFSPTAGITFNGADVAYLDVTKNKIKGGVNASQILITGKSGVPLRLFVEANELPAKNLTFATTTDMTGWVDNNNASLSGTPSAVDRMFIGSSSSLNVNHTYGNLGIGVAAYGVDGTIPLEILEDFAGLVQVWLRNRTAGGAFETLYNSFNSSLHIGAHSSTVSTERYRDAGVIGVNSDSSGGLVLDAFSPGQAISFYAGTATNGFQLSITNATLAGNLAANALTSTNGYTGLDLTASALLATDSNKKLVSISTGLGITNVSNTISNNIVAGANVTITAGTYGQLTIASSGGGGLSDGDKGDITVSGSGTVMTIDAGTVTLAKQANMATDSIVGRATAASGAPEVLTALPWADTGDVTRPADSAVTTIAANAVSDTKLRDSAGLSVIGRAANSSGDPADIVAANDTEVLRRSGTSIGFGTIEAAAIGSGTLGVTRGGTGAATLTGALIGNGTGAITGSSVDATELGYLDGATSSIQTQLTAAKTSAIGITIDGGGSAITTGVKGFVSVPYACMINSATILLDQSGSIVIDVWKDTYANYPPTVADTITASAKPTVSSATKSQDTTLTSWTTSVSAGDVIGFNVDSAATATRATLILKVTK